MQVPPTSILTLEPLYCSYSALRVILACRSAIKSTSASRHYLPKGVGNAQASVESYGLTASNHSQSMGTQIQSMGSQSQSMGSQSQLMGSQTLSMGSSAQSRGNGTLPTQSVGRQPQSEEHKWPNDQQGHRNHLLLPKALPQGNLSRYFDLACVTSGLRCLGGQQDAWEDAWLVLQHALGNLTAEGIYLARLL